MGKLGPRLSSRKKAKRWPKGQSSNSNPQTRKYRDQARSRFFFQNSGSTGLTTDALKKHDALQGLDPTEKIEVEDDESMTTGTFKTFGTFASNYSNCTNMSFGRFLTRFQSSSLIHKEMLAVLAAVTEVIKQNGGTESSTEYYAAFMTTLEQAESEESVAAILSLLGMGLKTVPKNVIKAQFSQASQVFIQVLTKYVETDNFLILRHCIGCLSILLRALEAVAWSSSSTMQILDGILTFTIHTKPKVRKAAQHAVCSILKGSDLMKVDNPPAYHPAASQIAKYCLQQFENAGQPGTITTTLHVLTLLKDIMHQLPKSYVKSICENLLKIMTLKNPVVTSCCFQTFHSLFVSKPSESVLPSQLNAQIINALYDYQPAPGDTQPTLAWLAVMQEAHANLANTSLYLCSANLPQIVEKSTELWLSDKTEVIAAASHTIKTLFQVCLPPMCGDDAYKYKKTLKKIIQLIRQGMKYQYNSAWHHVLHLIAVLFQITGLTCQDDLSPVLMELAELRDSYKFTYNSEVEYAVGAAVKSMGPEVVLGKIPLQTITDGIDLRRSWLLPVLKDCISKASLSYFINHMLPLATMCERKHKELKDKNDGIGAHSYELLTSQIWALLPSFCNNPSDIKDSFKSIARVLGMAISDRKDLRLSVMASLRKLINKSVENDKKEDVEELARFAKNYLPLLFNLYTTKPNGSDEEGQRLAAFDTIKVYLTITSKELCGELFDKALSKLQEPDQNDFVKQAVFDLIRILTQFTDQNRLQGLYEKCIPILMDDKNSKDQKKAYRFLEEICGSSHQVCKDFVSENRKGIQKILIRATPTVCTTSRGARLRCIGHLVKTHPKLEKTEFLKSIVPEIVMCVKDLNEKCRTSAYQLLNDIADKFMSSPGHFDDYIQMITVGLGGTPTYVSTTLLSLANLTYKYNGSIGAARNQEILNCTCTLLTGPTREVVLSALSYIKVYLSSFPTPVIGPNLPTIIQGLTGMTDDCKRHFRQKVRDILVKLIRKFGFDTIVGMIPQSDELMHKRIKNIKKIEARKQKLKEEKKEQKNKDDSDDEFNVNRRPKSMEEILADSEEEFDDSDIETEKNAKKKTGKQTWIQESAENIVDFVDPSAAKNITATKPGQNLMSGITKKNKSKDHGFKTSEDGRLIIKDSDDDDDDDLENEQKKKKKNKLPFLGSDSDDDYEDNDEDDSKSVASSKAGLPRKRKLSGSTDANSVSTSKYRAGGSGIHRPLKSAKVESAPGSEYKSKKAKGDIKKKGKHDPYAYLPLTRAALNRRKKLKNKGKFKGIISGAKKGAQIGSKARRKK
ncbi:RRP12-like protein [Chelonus insularis]|uniref:RRP12-like protein n=1 Tax=Chelonus insularis TaxID=460826 RepID=UPI0015894070|nr:RRP12-like protein [Chelonus insularis]